MKYLVSILLFISTNVNAGESLNYAKTNGVRFLLEDSESSKYNELIKTLVQEYWTFSGYDFITQKEYNKFSGDEKDFVIGLYDIIITFEGSESEIKVFACFNEHKHIAKKSKRLDSKSVVTQDYIPDANYSDQDFEALIVSLLKEHNNQFEKLYREEDLNKPTTSYGHLDQLKDEIGQWPIYILKEDMVLSEKDLSKINNPNLKTVSKPTINEAILNSEEVLIYRHEDYILAQSIKKLVNAKTGEVYVYILNRDLDHYNKGVLKNVVKRLAP